MANSQIARSDFNDFNTENLRGALEGGLNPNTQWQQVDIDGERPTGGCVIHGFNVESSWANYNTPLHMSLHKNQFSSAALLLEYGAQIDLRNALGRTPLHEAISRSDSEAVKFLISKGADLNVTSEERSFEDEDTRRSGIAGILPLHEAIRTWNLEAAELLVEGGADLTRISPGGWTILDLAVLERNEPMVNFLYKHDAQFSEYAMMSQEISPKSQREMAKTLLADTNMFPPSACRPVYLYVISHPEFLDVLRKRSAVSTLDYNIILVKFFSMLSEIAGKPNPENIPGAPKCTQCVKFLRNTSPEKSVPFQLYPDRSSLAQSAREGCCLCAIFEDALVHNSGDWAHPGRIYQQIPMSAEVILTSQFSIHKISITVHCENQCETLEVYNLSDSFMIDHQRFPDHAELGTASPRAFKTARAWLENCQTHHSACSEEKEANPLLPLRVIDVGNETTEPRLHVNNGERAPYLALSYCWGHSGNLTMTKRSLRNFTKVIPLSSLPLTLCDAVLATRQLGFRFLWVDALCIVQDDMNDWEREAAKMRAIYANATITLSAHDSDSTQGGLYRPRQKRLTSPVQVSLRAHKTGFYVLPVHGEKELLTPGPVNTRAWTLQEQMLSARILHWGPGILYWECLCSHGSESDPEGHTHPYNSICTDFMDVRHRKRVVQGCTQEGNFSYRHWPENESFDNHDLDDEPESTTEETTEAEALYLPEGSDKDMLAEGGNSDLENVEEEDTEDDQQVNPKKLAYLEWQKMVSEYSSRALTKTTDKIPAFLALSEMMAKTIQDEFVIGVWKRSYFFSSLLWVASKPGGRSRNQNYPSWTWASIDGRISYPINFSGITWEPSDAALDVQLSGPSQNHATGSITLRSRVRKLPTGFKFWRYKNLMFVEGFRDLRTASPEAKEAGGWEGAGSEIYCVVIGRIGKEPPPKFGYPAFMGGRPKSVVCLCLTPVRQEEGAEPEARQNVFRRVGLCHFWDSPVFWRPASKGQCMVII
ncbi:hypothetical protein F4860DRAFT_526273 [Xylaria cubensis]|nr:hypothetical protein F4860DRAFT_526273 [Xylaria cubensis]